MQRDLRAKLCKKILLHAVQRLRTIRRRIVEGRGGRAGEDVFFLSSRGGRRAREEVRKTCPSLHDRVQSRQGVSTTTRRRRCEWDDPSKTRRSIVTDVDTDISSEIIGFFSTRENIFRERIILLCSSRRTSREQTDPDFYVPTPTATIPVWNYHKPLTPARTKLFLHSDSNQLTITVLLEYWTCSVYFHIFRTIYCVYRKRYSRNVQ